MDFAADDFQGATEYLSKRVFTVKDMADVSYRTINYWQEKKFLLSTFPYKMGEWKKFNVFEGVWIMMLVGLRDLGVSIEKVIGPLFYHFRYVNAFGDGGPMNIENDLVPDEQFDAWKRNINLSFDPSYFMFCLVRCMLDRSKLVVRIYDNGECQILSSSNRVVDLEEYWKDITDLKGSFISIPISTLLTSFIGSMDVKWIRELKLLNDNEIEFLNYLRHDKVEDITVQRQNAEPYHIPDEKIKNADKSQRSDFLLEPYQQVTYRTIDGKTVTFTA